MAGNHHERNLLHAGDPPLRASAILDTRRLKEALRAVGPPRLFGFRLSASVCLALYVAFWLELDDACWAGTTAAIVCQPRLGALAGGGAIAARAT